MIAAIVLAAICSPLSASWVNAQPVLSWDYSESADAFTVHWREDGGPWVDCPQSHCWDDDSGVQWCVGQAIYYAIQRCVPLQEHEVEIVVTAENNFGPSGPSNSVLACLPHDWQCCEPYN